PDACTGQPAEPVRDATATWSAATGWTGRRCCAGMPARGRSAGTRVPARIHAGGMPASRGARGAPAGGQGLRWRSTRADGTASGAVVGRDMDQRAKRRGATGSRMARAAARARVASVLVFFQQLGVLVRAEHVVELL